MAAYSIDTTTLSSSGGNATIKITKADSTSRFVAVTVQELDWFDLTSSALDPNDDDVWKITVRANPETTGSARTFNIFVSNDIGENEAFTITQTAGTAITPISGEIKGTSTADDISASGGTFKVYVKASGTDADESETAAEIVSGSFCTLTGTNHSAIYDGVTCTEFTFTFAENGTYSARSASLRFTVYNDYGDSYSLSLIKAQSAKSQGSDTPAYVFMLPERTEVGAEDTTKDVMISDIQMYSSTYALVSKPNWVSAVSFSTVSGITTMTITFSANTDISERSGYIVISGETFTSETITTQTNIIQAAAEDKHGKIEIPIKNTVVSSDSGSLFGEITLTDISSVSVSANATWIDAFIINPIPSIYALRVYYDDNTLTTERTGTVTLSGTDNYGNTITYSFLLIQEGVKEVIDRVYVIDYKPNDSLQQYNLDLLYEGNLEFDMMHPIESVCHFETDEIQKIYWVDGKNPLRFMNIAASPAERASWDDTSFDSNRVTGFGVNVEISKDNSGNNRANGVVQYLLTYYNKHGQETGKVWMSDLVYLSPLDHGGSADGYNMNKVTLKITNLDTSFTHFRVYSVFRSTQDGQITAYLVSEQKTSSNEVYVIDDGAHLVSQEPTRILYLGSQPVIASTLTHKDNTLFLGDLQSIGRDFTDLEEMLRANMFVLHGSSFVDGVDWESKYIEFDYSGVSMLPGTIDVKDIPNVPNSGNYAYSNQLQYTSSEILSFKGGEKYRFALKFQMRDGTETDAFWIGDKENTLYPQMDTDHDTIKRVVAKCTLPEEVVNWLRTHTEYKTVTLCIAEATYSDRSVKAQGIVNPTMFNTWERFQGRTYAYPSWITRVRGTEFANQHFNVVESADHTTGEIQCNWWADGTDHDPFFQYKNYDTAPTYYKDLAGSADFDKMIIAYRIRYKVPSKGLLGGVSSWISGILTGGAISLTVGTVMTALAKAKAEFVVTAYIIKVKLFDQGSESLLNAEEFPIYDKDAKKTSDNSKKAFDAYWTPYGDSSVDSSKKGWYYNYHPSTGTKVWRSELAIVKVSGKTYFNKGRARSKVEERLKAEFLSLGLGKYFPHSHTFHQWCLESINASNHTYYANQQTYKDSSFGAFATPFLAINATETGQSSPSTKRWIIAGDYSVAGVEGQSSPAYYKKHLMYVDENIVTLDSPELEHNLVEFDNANYSFRIVGVAKMSSVMSDYTIDATHSSIPGMNLDREIFSGNIQGNKSLTGLITWPLWKEYGLSLTDDAQDDNIKDEDRTFGDYELNTQIVRYWLYMWQHPGSISGYSRKSSEDDTKEEEDAERYSELKHKTWANLRFAYQTLYLKEADDYTGKVESIRNALEYNTNTLRLTVGGEYKDYASNVQLSLSVPGNLKYPICYSSSRPDDTNKVVYSDDAYLYSSSPVLVEYATKTHAIISLRTEQEKKVTEDGNDYYYYNQIILPRFFSREEVDFSQMRGQGEIYDEDTDTTTTVSVSGALIPWAQLTAGKNYISIQRNGSDIADPVYQMLNYQDADFTNLFRTSGSGEQFERYVDVINAAMDTFEDGDVYMTISTGTAKFVVNIADMAVTQDENTGIYTITLTDPDTIGAYFEGSDDTIGVNYAIAMYDSNEGVITTYVGSGQLDVYTGIITNSPYPYRDYTVEQREISTETNVPGKNIEDGDLYVFLGEVYESYSDPAHDTRYGGITLSKVQNNRFVTAGPAYEIDKDGNTMYLFANQGDTYFQRWDSLRIKPYSDDAVNRQIDITSVMVETHINLDGRTDLQRGINELASINTTTFGQLNRVYSQQNNFVVRRDLDEDFNTDTFRSSVTWTLPKMDMADVDEWTHVTMASTLKLDGDKGYCNALRRFNNRIIAFQDRGISEIYFNAMTQIGTQEGVPIEIANSGKVTGKGYFTNKYGCTNKWSIVEGKAGLYFVDNINKAFCDVTVGQRGQLGATDISTSKGFGVWFRTMCSPDIVQNTEPWRPKDFNNFVSFYDRIHGDIYLVGKEYTNSLNVDAPCLVYSDTLGEFASFYDYGSVSMMANVGDRFFSVKNNTTSHTAKLWRQNEGMYCNFFGTVYPFWVQYRVCPEPYGDKIWTNLEYRADFYRVLEDGSDGFLLNESSFADGINAIYQPNETFDFIRCWNEYQTTEDDESKFSFNPEKKFRIWRYQIPRAKQDDTYNKYGLDRIRNPWMNILLKKKYSGTSDLQTQDLMQLHDVSVIYFE